MKVNPLKVIRPFVTPFARLSTRAHVAVAAVEAVVLLACWQFLTPPLIPHPGDIIQALFKLAENSLLDDVLASLWLNLQAMVISTVISLLLAYSSTIAVFRPMVFVISKLRFLSMTGLAFIFGLFVTGHYLKVWLLVFGVSVYYVTSMVAAIEAVKPEKYEEAVVMRMGPWQTLYEVVVRGRFDEALNILVQNSAMCLMMLTFVEGIVRSEGGIGASLLNENKSLRLDSIAALQLVAFTLGMGQDYLLKLLRSAVAPQADVQKGGK